MNTQLDYSSIAPGNDTFIRNQDFLILLRVRFGGREGVGLIPRCDASETRFQGSPLGFNANF